MQIHANLRDTAGLFADHHNIAHIAIKQIMQIFFGFPVPIPVLFLLYYSLLSMQ